MNIKDLFGYKTDIVSRFTLFQDESDCEKSNFLYHGFLFVRNRNGRKILNELMNVKKKYNREKREIHFNELNQHSKSPYGVKTRIALGWLNLTRKNLENDTIKFYCFGINKNNVKNFWINPNSYEKNIYLRFFEIGLKSAIIWFNLNKINFTYLDSGRYDEGRKQRIRWLNLDFFKKRLSNVINTRNLELLSSDEKESKSEFSNFLQLVDILTGVTRSSFVKLGENQKGQKECMDDFIDVIERFNNSKTAYRKGSRYWKKFCIQFFPTLSNLTKDEFLSNSIEDLLKRGNFYCDRLTYKQQLRENKKLKLNFPNL